MQMSLRGFVLYPLLDDLHCRYALAAPEQFVDDLSQIMEGTAHDILTHLVGSAIQLHRGLIQLGVDMSSKSCVLASNQLLGDKIKHHLLNAGSDIPLVKHGKDLGEGTNSGGRRTFKEQQ